MSVTRDFDAMLAEKAGVKPTFKIGGQEFTLRAKLPYAKWNKLLAVMSDPDGDDMAASEQFFKIALIKADRERFSALLHAGAGDDDEDDDDDAVIGLSQMPELTDWVMEHFTGKAQSASNSSSPGANGTGAQPNVISLKSKQAANG